MSTFYDDWYDQVRVQIDQLFPNPASLRFAIDELQQKQALDRLEVGAGFEQFYCVIDLLTHTISHAGGLDQIGWPNQLTLREYIGYFPDHGNFNMIGLLAKQTVEIARLTDNAFLEPKLITLLPVRHGKTDKMLLVKRTLSPWQTTTEGLVTAYLNEFVIIKDYEGEAMHPRFSGIPAEVAARFYQSMRQAYAQLPNSQNPFSPKELDILRLYISGPKQPLEAIASAAKITQNTLKDYNKSILEKARLLYGQKATFRSARDVAEHMKKSQIVQ
jgi:DNA-binding CsgD family transcriptional regulator